MDPEKGVLSATAHSVMPSTASSTPAKTNEHSTHTPLQLFQLLIGIHTPASLTEESCERGNGSREKCRRSENVGLYQMAKRQERRSRINYLCTSYISNTLYMFQILLAATFTALSAYKDTSTVVLTVLGALNTVLAGCLAWQKGQGVPQRYRKAQDQYQALVLDIEMTERSFVDLESTSSKDGTKLDPRVEKARLQKLYDTARADQQANYPDLYVSTNAPAAKEAKDLAKQLDDVKADAAKVQGDLMARIEGLLARLEGKTEGKAEVRAVEDAITSAVKT